MKVVVTLLLFFMTSFLFAQERQMINGKVVSRSRELKDIYVSNLNTGDAVMTEKGGYFNLLAKDKDTLMFSGALFMAYRYELDQIDLERDIVLIPLEPNELYSQLDEIVITKITSESLGLIPRGTKRYTPMERKLYTATSGGGIIPVSAIVNWISGRTKMLKKALKYEQQESRKDRLLRYFSEERLTKDYNIPSEYVVGFAYYAAIDDQMESLLSSGAFEKERVESRLGELVFKFLELINKKEETNNELEVIN
ncbi:hypothetical protein [Myroides injenensis]|uniref:hypothetical protein n=1 Tax=Myroides injenensis TaxID=1183151 RepID=UPI0002887CEF|nr:hypothetical protein [Myroides injenensis]